MQGDICWKKNFGKRLPSSYIPTDEQHGSMISSGGAAEMKLHLTGSFLYYHNFWLKAKLIKTRKDLGCNAL